jgi:hypothetical protein
VAGCFVVFDPRTVQKEDIKHEILSSMKCSENMIPWKWWSANGNPVRMTEAHRGHFEHLQLNFCSECGGEMTKVSHHIRNFGKEIKAVTWKGGFYVSMFI